jgi:hypothetical protein
MSFEFLQYLRKIRAIIAEKKSIFLQAVAVQLFRSSFGLAPF